jgi:phosphoenolpyruvate---glycerone phosphotransferase subunit DhaL
MTTLSRQTFVAAVRRMAAIFEEEMDALSRLDAVIGDGDHGISMARGFRIVAEKLPAVEGMDIGAVAGMVGDTLTGGIGGVTGPVFGTVFTQLAAHAQGKHELSVAELATAFVAALEGVQALGGAQIGDKTMVDALAPAAEALARGANERMQMGQALELAAQAAEAGARSTEGMKATKGRARYLGERSIGHRDPGAVSFSLIMRALKEAYLSSPTLSTSS